MAALLPYDMFDVDKSADEARRFAKMQRIYHKGQELAWDGRAVLAEIWERHGGSRLASHQKAAAQRVLGGVMWGELAAWKIAAQLADEIETLEGRMAATSQAHDEARHFYVMHDYLVRATGDFPRRTNWATERLLAAALKADSLAKKLLGMQLQLEATALTLFHALRESGPCPVLRDLLLYYERDEARHVGLGMQLLPSLMQRMSPLELVRFSAFSLKVASISVAALKVSEDDLRTLGVDPRRVAVLGKSKQMLVFNELFRIIPEARSEAGDRAGRVIDAVAEVLWPHPAVRGAPLEDRVRHIFRTLAQGIEQVETSLEPDDTSPLSNDAAA
jgi:hypothetical protein